MSRTDLANPQGHGALLWAIGLGGFLINADNRAIAPILPAIAADYHVSATMAALLVTAYALPYGLFQLVYGPVADRIGKIQTILAALSLFSIGTIGCGLANHYSWLLILRFVTGVFAAGVIPTTLAHIGDIFDMRDRPRAIAFFMSMSTSGQALGIVIGGIVAQFLSYQWLFLLIGLGCLPTLWTLRGHRGPRPVVSEAKDPMRDKYKRLFRQGRTWVIYGLVFTEGLLFFGAFTFLGVFGVEVLKLSYFAVGLLTAVYSVGAFIGSRTITLALSRVTHGQLALFGGMLMAIGFAIPAIFHNPTAFGAGFLCMGFGYSYCHSTLQTFATDLLPGARATAVSVFAFCLFVGMGVGPTAYGWMYDHTGPFTALLAAAVALAVFSCACGWSLRARRTIPTAPNVSA